MGKVDVAAKVVGQVASPRLVGELRQGPNPLWTATRRSATTAAKPVTGHGIVIARGSLLLVEQMQPLVLVTPVLVTISELTATTPMASDTMILHRTMPLTPARIVELVEEAVYTVLDTTGDCNCNRTTSKMRGFVSQDHIGGFSTKRECANTHK
jgi:hypothetical protein